MSTKVFLSHSHKDRRQALIIRDLLRGISAGQMDIWFSSDDHPESGLSPGDWYQQIMSRLSASKSLIALITPISIDNRWMHFECGIAEASNLPVIPVCAGLQSLSDVPAPLNRYQSYQLSDYESLKTFVGKLLNMHDLALFEEVAEPAIKRAISAFSAAGTQRTEMPRISIEDAVEALKAHIDRRLLGAVNTVDKTEVLFVPYAINISCRTPSEILKFIINIEDDTTVQDVLDNTYFAISAYVKPFTYLSEWMMRDRRTHMRLVIREIDSLVPAQYIFKPRSDWQVLLLLDPYHPNHSDDNIRAFRV